MLHTQPTEPLPPVPATPAVGEQSAKAGRPRRASSTYVRQGTACLLAAFEPGTGQRLIEVSVRRTGPTTAALGSDWPPTTSKRKK